MKRTFDLLFASIGLLVSSPITAVAAILISVQDRRSPFYISDRVGKGGRSFRMVKLRSMVVGADKHGVVSTGPADPRTTAVGRVIRRYKIDELPQLWNVVRGDMSLVGPRPNVQSEVDVYTPVEMRVLTLRPGVTDLASIVFADQGEILRHSSDPVKDYREVVRPWKSRLALFYIDHQNLSLDAAILVLTLTNVIARQWTLERIERLLRRRGADDELCSVARRSAPLRREVPPGHAPPGSRLQPGAPVP